jgi:hypothetical protein
MRFSALWWALVAMGPHATEVKMFAPQEIQSVDDTLTVQLKGRTVKPLGVQARDPRAARDMLERLLRSASGIRIVPDETAPAPDMYYVEYVALMDRSGPIWLDAGHVLIGQKAATVDTRVPFARRAAYQATQDKAEQGKGPRYPND